MERWDVVAARHRYLRQIKKYREEGWQIVYVDETWINANHTKSKRWIDTQHEDQTRKLNPPSGKGQRLIILNAGSDNEGFIPDVEVVFVSKKDGDYHHEMNGRHFMEWFQDHLLPALQEPTAVILDNASYHNIRVEGTKPPTSSSTKKQMQDWLEDKGIKWDHGMLKVSDNGTMYCKPTYKSAL